MAMFEWEGRNELGDVEKGELEAANLQEAQLQLRSMPTTVKRMSGNCVRKTSYKNGRVE